MTLSISALLLDSQKGSLKG